MKKCSGCLETKSYDHFYPVHSRPGQYMAFCKPCNKARSDEWKKKNPERFKKQNRNWMLKRSFGITTEERDAMLENQGGVCAICKGAPDKQHYTFSVDHYDPTGDIRGILCGNCNCGIGQFKDKPELLRAAILYLQESGLYNVKSVDI